MSSLFAARTKTFIFFSSSINFFNSEIVGKETYSEFGVVFKKLGEDFARHPAQLYEALSYFIIFFIGKNTASLFVFAG